MVNERIFDVALFLADHYKLSFGEMREVKLVRPLGGELYKKIAISYDNNVVRIIKQIPEQKLQALFTERENMVTKRINGKLKDKIKGMEVENLYLSDVGYLMLEMVDEI